MRRRHALSARERHAARSLPAAQDPKPPAAVLASPRPAPPRPAVRPVDGATARAGSEPGSRGWLGTLGAWSRILSAYGVSQTATQALGLAAGLVFVRSLPVQQYALYTLAVSAATFLSFLTDLGSTGSLVYFFQEAERQGADFEGYAAAVESLRRSAFGVGGAGLLLILPPALRARGFDVGPALAVGLAVLPLVWFQIAAQIRLLRLRLGGHYGASYRAEVAGGGVRLVLAIAMAAAAVLPAWLAVLTGAAGAATVATLARTGGEPPRPARRAVDGCRRQVLRYLLPTLPSALYFSLQGPLVVWLAATFGGTQNIAEVGALGRLGLLIGLFSGLGGVVLLPRLARVTDEGLWRRRTLQYGAFLGVLALLLLAAAAAAPQLFLQLLGEPYEGLRRELRLVIAGAGITLLGGYGVAVNASRSWNRWQGPAVAFLAACQAVLVAILPLGTTAGVLWFGLWTALAGLVPQAVITGVGFVRPERVRWV